MSSQLCLVIHVFNTQVPLFMPAATTSNSCCLSFLFFRMEFSLTVTNGCVISTQAAANKDAKRDPRLSLNCLQVRKDLLEMASACLGSSRVCLNVFKRTRHDLLLFSSRNSRQTKNRLNVRSHAPKRLPMR